MADMNSIDKNSDRKQRNLQSLSPSRLAVIHRRKIKRILFIASAVLLIISFVVIIFICKSCMAESEQKRQQEVMVAQLKTVEGLWRYDEHTEYEFDGKGNGRMYYDEGKYFAFTYTVNDDVLALDFELEYVNDCKYSFIIKDEKMTFTGGEGTAVIGKVYELDKINVLH